MDPLYNNPYGTAPGEPSPDPNSGTAISSEIAPGRFEIFEVFGLVWRTLKAQWLTGSLGAVIFLAVSTGASLIFEELNGLFQSLPAYADFIAIYALNYFLQFLLGFAAMWFAYAAIKATLREEKVDIGEFFASFNHIADLLKLTGILCGIMLLVSLPGIGLLITVYYMFLESAMAKFMNELLALDLLKLGNLEIWKSMLELQGGIWLASLTFVVGIWLPQFYISIRLEFAWLLLMERKVNVQQSLNESWALTTGNSARILGYFSLWTLLVLTALPFTFVGMALTCMVGTLAFFPMIFMNWLHFPAMYHYLMSHHLSSPEASDDYPLDSREPGDYRRVP